ncbi:uncharacterized protein LOC107045671 [Diachasma alloeum]|uniref:uncharacterized protein LOC107045671 n=1 Tax=Diachasma alloeum TaxID=454923 RepID=UPI00073841B8|nr:uncharacterized protein LOC107045671 [Diachasma alloeum]
MAEADNEIDFFTLASNDDVDYLEPGYNIMPLLGVIRGRESPGPTDYSWNQGCVKMIFTNLTGRAIRMIFWGEHADSFVQNITGQIVAFVSIMDTNFTHSNDSDRRPIDLNIYEADTIVHYLGRVSGNVRVMDGRAIVERQSRCNVAQIEDAEEFKETDGFDVRGF